MPFIQFELGEVCAEQSGGALSGDNRSRVAAVLAAGLG